MSPALPPVHLTGALRETLAAVGLDARVLADQFQQWKDGQALGREHYAFGRDAAGLGNPRLRHVHLVPLFVPQDEQRWRLAWRRGSERKSDRYLFYADGTPAHGYLLIAVINDPGAHAIWQPKHRAFIRLIERIADDFHHHGTLPD